jgi:hypothetical protein
MVDIFFKYNSVYTEPVFVNLLRSPGSIPSKAVQYDDPICRTGPPNNIGWRNRFLGSINVYKHGLCTVTAVIHTESQFLCQFDGLSGMTGCIFSV